MHLAQKLILPGNDGANIEIEGAPELEATFGGADFTFADIISRLLPLLLSFAGIILFVMLIWGGYQMLYSAGDPQAAQAARQKITAAIIGFVIVITAYLLTQALNFIFGIG